jgi:GntP family gluconate:H+ symporter
MHERKQELPGKAILVIMICLVTGIPLLIIIAASIVLVIVLSARFKVHPFLALLFAALGAGLVAGIPSVDIIPIMTRGFGEMAGAIGLIITFGTLIGVMLEESGAAQSIAQVFLRWLGKKHITFSMSLIGALVGIPVFCDSGFMMLQAPGKRLALQSGKNPASISIATATGLYSTHVLVPPTPGPLAAAGNIGAEQYLGMVILFGLVTSIPAILAGFAWAKRISKSIYLMPETPINLTGEEIKNLPAFWKSILPIVLPLLLIILGTFLRMSDIKGNGIDILVLLTHPVFALAFGLISGLVLLGQNEKIHWMEKAIMQAGPILLVTAAGGSFGAVLKNLPINEFFNQALLTQNWKGAWILPIVFCIAALIKTSQGSSTAALIIVSSLLSPLLPAMNIEGAVPLSLLVCAIGSGAMVISHTNDSYFWVISRFSGMNMQQTLKGFSISSFWMGLSALAMTIILWIFLV